MNNFHRLTKDLPDQYILLPLNLFQCQNEKKSKAEILSSQVQLDKNEIVGFV